MQRATGYVMEMKMRRTFNNREDNGLISYCRYIKLSQLDTINHKYFI